MVLRGINVKKRKYYSGVKFVIDYQTMKAWRIEVGKHIYPMYYTEHVQKWFQERVTDMIEKGV